MSDVPQLVFGGVALGCVAAAAVADLRHFEIPDQWSIAIAALFAAFAFAALPFGAWWPHPLAGALVFLGGALLFARGWLGGGDVKLLAACAVWTGFAGLPQFLVGTAACGGLLALTMIVARRVSGPEPAYPGLAADGPLPYAVAILGGALTYAATV